MLIWAAGAALSFAALRLDFSESKLLESLRFQGQRLDIAFFGNSLTLEGVSPTAIDARLGTASYNFALGGASLLESELQLRHYLASNPPPKLVALGVYLDSAQRYTGISPALYYALDPGLRRLYWERSAALEHEGFDRSFVFFNRFAAYRYRGVVDLLIKWLVTREDTRPRFVRGQAQANFSRAAVELGPPHRADFPFEELESFLRLCQERAIPVLVFEPPLTPGEPELTANRSETLEQARRAVEAFTGASFVSFAALGQSVPKGDWVNLNHLNVRGADSFSRELAQALAARLR
ncbi:MAG TPA: hypothetical protein VH083_23665 [Myxococcales bacterium]|nr:hypothetical protein [Myxococcales bacterium]